MAVTTRKIIFSAEAPPPLPVFSQAVLVDKTLYVSGSIGVDKNHEMVAGGIDEQTRQTLRNIGAVLKAASCDYNNVVKATVLLSDMANFAAMNAVYMQFFNERKPARTAYQVSALPFGALVEIEVIAIAGEIADQ